jgi:single-strand DNA-binding protein
MSRCVNSVILLGNCGKAPEIRYTASGKVLAKLSLAVNESFKDSQGDRQERTHWVSIVAWQRLAEIVGEYVLQGTRLYVQGRLNTESWDDRRSGQKRYRMSVVAEKLIVLEHARQRNDATKPSAPPEAASVGTGQVSDDSEAVPF